MRRSSRSSSSYSCWTLCVVYVFLLAVPRIHCFYHSSLSCSRHRDLTSPLRSDISNDNDKPRRPRSNQQRQQQVLTIADLRDQLLQNPAQWQQQQQQLTQQKKKRNNNNNNSKTTPGATSTTARRRTRRRVDQPQQTYLYASQRNTTTTTTSNTTTLTVADTVEETIRRQQAHRREWVQELGLQWTSVQHCDPPDYDKNVQPSLVGQIRVQDNNNGDDDDPDETSRSSTSGQQSSQYAYLIDKPVGWSILGKNKNNNINSNKRKKTASPLDSEILELLTPQERQEYDDSNDNDNDSNTIIPQTPRPSVVAWLKEWKASQGKPIKGGNFWTAVAGASEVDDSGLLLLCPKTQVHNIFVERAEYTAVMGNGGYLAPSSSSSSSSRETSQFNTNNNAVTSNIVARLRKGRGDDVVETVHLVMADRPSICAHAVPACQTQFGQGIRGDAAGSPLDRYAPRRLIHCRTLSVSSLVDEEHLEHTTATVPDDIAVWSERRNHCEYTRGSFLGRQDLRNSPSTTAYREINGAADGFPGWTVDRYGEWLLVSHDPQQPRGPLPSIHDGYTAGVYYLEQQQQSRHKSGRKSSSTTTDPPRLIEGRPAPELVPVLENGVTYLVSLDRDLSTGLFLDQRPQRAWLTRHCTRDTRLLNCFSHTGAFSVAAAVAGATTVNLDLSTKWLDRFPQHLQANGIPVNEQDEDGARRHDCIYGDCFDWLARLAKRGETYDIVILDPPSSSVGTKKKRWSVKNDMSELVTLAARLVRKGGLLWTTTNSKSLSAEKFARLCRQGLDDAGLANAKLERIQPMPVDFPSVGPQAVKNLVWRIPN